MAFEFAAPSALDADNMSANTARLLNMYREPAGDGAIWCKSLLGMTQFADTGTVFCRAMAEIKDEIYLAQGGSLFRITSAGVPVLLGAINDSPETSISGNNGNITVVAGGVYYVWDGTTLTTPTGGAFEDFGDVSFFGQLTLLTERNGRRVQWSGVANAEALSGTNYATTEARDDINLRVMPVGSSLWIMKQTSIEPWYQSGEGIAAVPAATIDRGLKARNLAVQIPSGVFFIGDDNQAYLGAASLDAVSTTAVNTSISQSDAVRVLYFEDEGHKFCAIIFSDRPALLYNLSTGEWCERAEGNDLLTWTARACVKANGSFYIATEAGMVARLERTNADLGRVMLRRIISRTFNAGGARFSIAKAHVQTRVGFFDVAPLIGVRMSKDFGMTWGDNRQLSLGERGEFLTRTIFRRLGQFRQATMEITLSDAVDVNIKATVET